MFLVWFGQWPDGKRCFKLISKVERGEVLVLDPLGFIMESEYFLKVDLLVQLTVIFQKNHNRNPRSSRNSVNFCPWSSVLEQWSKGGNPCDFVSELDNPTELAHCKEKRNKCIGRPWCDDIWEESIKTEVFSNSNTIYFTILTIGLFCLARELKIETERKNWKWFTKISSQVILCMGASS